MLIKDSNGNSIDLLDVLTVLSFYVGILNLDMNITQNDLQRSADTLDKALRTQVSEIHAHLKEQDRLLREIKEKLEYEDNREVKQLH